MAATSPGEACFFEGGVDGFGGCIAPGVGMLLLGARQADSELNHKPRRLPRAPSVSRIDDQDFGRLGAAINANDKVRIKKMAKARDGAKTD